MGKLIVFDMDGIIFEHINFWLELHKAYGTHEEGAKLTKNWLRRLLEDYGRTSQLRFILILSAE